MKKLIRDFKIHCCPYCRERLIYPDEIFDKSQETLINTKSEEHIIPKSLGNDTSVLPSGIICDKYNNYFSTNIEKPFLEIESIKLLRCYHLIPSRKKKVPPINALFCGDLTELEYDRHMNAMRLNISPETAYKLYSGIKPKMFFTKSISLEELTNNYIVSRLLVKIFTELHLYYQLCHLQTSGKIDDTLDLQYEAKAKELIDYVRRGKPGKIYDYEVTITKPIIPFSGDDFVASVNFVFENKDYVKMVFNLFELCFTLNIY